MLYYGWMEDKTRCMDTEQDVSWEPISIESCMIKHVHFNSKRNSQSCLSYLPSRLHASVEDNDMNNYNKQQDTKQLIYKLHQNKWCILDLRHGLVDNHFKYYYKTIRIISHPWVNVLLDSFEQNGKCYVVAIFLKQLQNNYYYNYFTSNMYLTLRTKRDYLSYNLPAHYWKYQRFAKG